MYVENREVKHNIYIYIYYKQSLRQAILKSFEVQNAPRDQQTIIAD